MPLVGIAAELLQLDQALFRERVEAVIGLAQAYAHGFCQVALAHLRLSVQQLKALGIGEDRQARQFSE